MNTVAADGWETLPVSDIADFGSGEQISVASLADRPISAFQVPVFGGNGIAGYTNRALITNNTVILGRVGQKCGIVYRSDAPVWVTDNALYARRFKRPVDVRFLALILESAQLNDLRNRNDLPLITQGILRGVVVRWPASTSVQGKIADVFELVGQEIAALDRLIRKKQAIKHGMMQSLLTSKARLPGFTDAWVPLHVASRSTLKARIGWQGLTTSEYRSSGEYRLVGGTEFVDGRVDWRATPYVDKWRFDQDLGIQLRHGDVLLTKDGTIGKTAYVDQLPGPATLNSGVFVIRPMRQSYDSRFLYYMLRSRAFDKFLARLAAGSTISHLYQRDLVGLVLDVPPTLEEQSAISSLLADVDGEIDALRRRIDKAKAIKQGMMQELLSGRTRLPVVEAVA